MQYFAAAEAQAGNTEKKMGKVIIKKLKIKTCHGVNDFEKRQPQLFEFSAEVTCDFYEAAKNDEIAQTINYSTVCKIITAVATQNVFNLIETLASRCAEAILDNFPKATAVKVRVEKPQAPVRAKFKTMAAEAELKRVTAYLSLGSSMGDRKAYLDFAVKELAATRGITVKKVSSYMESEPYGGVAHNKFLNACVEVNTYLPPRALLFEIHRIEAAGERSRTLRWDDRTLDIDIIFYGREVICEDGLTVPHADYANRPFVTEPLKEIAPDFICPATGMRVKDILPSPCGGEEA